ncbi:hypothetical protein N7539_005552 [Penicillium diatomitis]|uniref:Uncharacterized protein n=1 Tax=Penicillium diatomitis TaxID=2819901 RepID=A0A9X0BUU8_9EURO|nr:uncharacterized protein N7539_005552 [Penicillium diatomitis]KAJ5485564.1 hypothetical protein N7539_005552 [Penicillium diatomitis]
MPRPGEQEWVHWAKHKELYGPISSVTVLEQTIVLINDPKTATELLNKRSSIYSSRPRMVFANDLGTGSWKVALQGLTGTLHSGPKLQFLSSIRTKKKKFSASYSECFKSRKSSLITA